MAPLPAPVLSLVRASAPPADGVPDAAALAPRIQAHLAAAAGALGFRYWRVAVQLPVPITDPVTIWHECVPPDLTAWLAAHGPIVDPTLAHGRRAHTPLVWSRIAFRDAPILWRALHLHGMGHGWSQAYRGPAGVLVVLSVARTEIALSRTECRDKAGPFAALTKWVHDAVAADMLARHCPERRTALTGRERDALRWAADGKTASETAAIMGVAPATVSFHMKNAVDKLQVANKTAAVVKAAMLGLL